MKKRLLTILILSALMLPACGNKNAIESENDTVTNIDVTNKKEDIAGINLEDGRYQIDVKMEGGSGKAYIQSPCELTVKEGKGSIVLVWSSKNYDYMIVNDIKYMNENEGAESTFTIPIESIDDKLTVIGDTVAMSTPHEIEYVLTFALEK